VESLHPCFLVSSIVTLQFVSKRKKWTTGRNCMKKQYLAWGLAISLSIVHFTELSGHHSVLERPLSEVNGRLFFS